MLSAFVCPWVFPVSHSSSYWWKESHFSLIHAWVGLSAFCPVLCEIQSDYNVNAMTEVSNSTVKIISLNRLIFLSKITFTLTFILNEGGNWDWLFKRWCTISFLCVTWSQHQTAMPSFVFWIVVWALCPVLSAHENIFLVDMFPWNSMIPVILTHNDDWCLEQCLKMPKIKSSGQIHFHTIQYALKV